jgi:hypothetical protein
VAITREDRTSAGVVSAKVRWLAIAAGCSAASFGVAGFGLCFLILGAAIQPRAPITARWLMWIGALLLTLLEVSLAPEMILEGAKLLRSGHGTEGAPAYGLLLYLSTILVIWCDVALVMDGLRRRGSQWVRGSLDWVVWIVASALSTWCVLTSTSATHAYWRLGGLRPDIVLAQVGFDAVILVFDLALIVHAIRTRRVT